MNRYPEYKDSGVEWIGKIPSHWSIGKIYQYGSLANGSTPSRREPSYWENGTIPWMNSGEINKRIIKNIDGRITEKGQKNSSTPFLDVGTVMVALNGQGKTKGTVGILQTKTTCNQSLCGISFKDSIDPKYQFYYLESQYKPLRGLVGDNKREGISVSFLSRYSVLVPLLQEQAFISRYLDKQTSQIDSLIEKISRKIELLKEQRTSLINQCVTKGLDLDVEMKDSGIEWMGEIPSHWTVISMKYIATIFSGSTPKSRVEKYWNGSINWYTPSDLELIPIKYLNQSTRKITELGLKSCGCNLVKPDSLVLSTRAPVGKVGISKVDFATNQGCKSLCVRENLDVNFLYYYLLVNTDALNSVSNGTTFLELSADSLSNFPVVLPSLNEQTTISCYLDRNISQINSLIEKETRRIELLKEYRQSLISNVVTGKVRIAEEMI